MEPWQPDDLFKDALNQQFHNIGYVPTSSSSTIYSLFIISKVEQKMKVAAQRFRIPETSRYTDSFKGVIVDTGAAKSCIGKKQLTRTLLFNHRSHRSNLIMRFRVPLVFVEISLPLPDDSIMRFRSGVVSANVPFLSCIDFMKREGVIINVPNMEFT